jgi:hypothetical protein
MLQDISHVCAASTCYIGSLFFKNLSEALFLDQALVSLHRIQAPVIHYYPRASLTTCPLLLGEIPVVILLLGPPLGISAQMTSHLCNL